MKFIWFRHLVRHLHKNPVRLGIDIGQASIKLIAAIGNYPHCRVLNYVEAPFSAPTATITALQTALEQINGQSHKAVLGLSQAMIITKQIQLSPTLTEVEVAEHIALESERYFSQPSNQVCFDFEILASNSQLSTKMDVYVVAARRKTVLSQVAIAQRAGCKITAVTPESQALLKLLQRLDLPSVALIHIRPSSFLLLITDKQQLIFCEEENYLTDRDLIAIMQRHCQVFPPHKILLSGEKQLTEELIAAVQQATQIPSILFNPFSGLAKIPVELQQQGANWAMSLALALWRPHD